MGLGISSIHNVIKQTIVERIHAVFPASGRPYSSRALLTFEIRICAASLKFIFE